MDAINFKKFDVVRYVSQYGLIGPDDFIKPEYMANLYYTALQKKFQIELDTDEYIYFQEYQKRISDFVNDIRQLEPIYINIIMEYLDANSVYTNLIILLTWSVPHFMEYFSHRTFDSKYLEYINNYGEKILRIDNITPIINICVEVVSDDCHFYAHCLDYFWEILSTFIITPKLINNTSAHVGLKHLRQIEPDDENVKMIYHVELSFSLPYIKFIYKNREYMPFYQNVIMRLERL